MRLTDPSIQLNDKLKISLIRENVEAGIIKDWSLNYPDLSHYLKGVWGMICYPSEVQHPILLVSSATRWTDVCKEEVPPSIALFPQKDD